MAEKRRLKDAQVGDTIGPYRYRLTQEMAEYAAALQEGDSSRYTNDTSFGGPIAPGCVTDNDYFLAWKDKFVAEEAVHAKAEHYYINPPLIGKELIVTGRVSDKYDKRGKGFLVFETVTRDEDGREIVGSKNTLLISLE